MTRTVTAAVVESAGAPFAIRQLELDGPRDDEALVELACTGVCHTDLIVRDGQAPVPFPAVLGHEGAGVVRAVGANVEGFVPGDRVVLSTDSCGKCTNCRAARPYACMNFFAYNFVSQRIDGTTAFSLAGSPIHSHYFGQSSFASMVVVRSNSLIRADDDVPFEVLAPLACGVLTGAGAVLGVQRPDVGDSIVVFGLGAVGLSAVMAARISGCAVIIAVDPVASRRQLALELGATAVVAPQDRDPVEEVRRLTASGVRFAVEASGVPAALDQAIAAMASGGNCAILGAPPPGTKLTLDVQGLIASHQSVSGITIGGSPARQFIPELIDHWRAGALPVERLVTVFRHDRINEAIEATKAGDVIKPVLRYETQFAV